MWICRGDALWEPEKSRKAKSAEKGEKSKLKYFLN